MYRIFSIFIIVILIITTLCILFFKPKMHKTVMIYDSAYEIVHTAEEKNITTELPTQTNTPKVQKTTQTSVPKTKTQKVITRVVEIPQKQQTTQNKNVNTTVVKQTQKITPKKLKTTKQITPEQEVVLWNKWRSDLQNQIMRDVRLPIVQEGTVFKFSFEVDKYGKVSNVQTWSTNPMYTPYAIQYIAPVIKSYQGRSILNFPSGSNRFVTVVDGGWKIAKTTKYSTPADFKDVETLRN